MLSVTGTYLYKLNGYPYYDYYVLSGCLKLLLMPKFTKYIYNYKKLQPKNYIIFLSLI